MSVFKELFPEGLRLNIDGSFSPGVDSFGIVIAICALADEVRALRLLKEEQGRQFAEEDAAARKLEERRLEITSQQIGGMATKVEQLLSIPVPAYTDPSKPHPFIPHDALNPSSQTTPDCTWCGRKKDDTIHQEARQ